MRGLFSLGHVSGSMVALLENQFVPVAILRGCKPVIRKCYFIVYTNYMPVIIIIYTPFTFVTFWVNSAEDKLAIFFLVSQKKKVQTFQFA